MRSDAERYFKNKYNYFFLSILLLLSAEPLLRYVSFPSIAISYLLIMLTLVWALKLHHNTLKLCLIVALTAFIFGIITETSFLAKDSSLFFFSSIACTITHIIFLLIVIKLLLWKIFSEKRVTSDTVRGGISIYLLLGIFWSFLYLLTLTLSPSAIKFPTANWTVSDLLYFSFTTLTTLGYGDILPVSPPAQMLTVLESTLGQIFLTVFIARLVGLYIRGYNVEVKETTQPLRKGNGES
jgi:hypothetical protein